MKVLVDIEGLEERLDEFDFGFVVDCFYDLLYGFMGVFRLPFPLDVFKVFIGIAPAPLPAMVLGLIFGGGMLWEFSFVYYGN